MRIATDVIVEWQDKIVLIERKNPPLGLAIPGGMIDEGESAETAAVREMKEEISMDVKLIHQLGTYSEPDRDPRGHVISVVFVGEPIGWNDEPVAADDAKKIVLIPKKMFGYTTMKYLLDNQDSFLNLKKLVFDHQKILIDYTEYLERKNILDKYETTN